MTSSEHLVENARRTLAGQIAYHPDPEINAEIIDMAIESEAFETSVGYPPRAWTCVCGATHNRGSFMTIGTHRCLKCGYIGTEGVMHGSGPGGAHQNGEDFRLTEEADRG